MPTAHDIMAGIGPMLDRAADRFSKLPSAETIAKYSTVLPPAPVIKHRPHRISRLSLYSEQRISDAHETCLKLRPGTPWHDIADLLKVPLGTLYKWQKKWKDMPPSQIGGKW